MGFGTIPNCTGCDHDDFIDPGAEIEITFERLGTLRCRFAEPTGKLLPSRWPVCASRCRSTTGDPPSLLDHCTGGNWLCSPRNLDTTAGLPVASHFRTGD